MLRLGSPTRRVRGTGPPGDVGQAEFLVRITIVIATAVRHHAPVVTSDPATSPPRRLHRHQNPALPHLTRPADPSSPISGIPNSGVR